MNEKEVITKNQVHPPTPRKKRVDSLGNDKRKLWLKDGHTTMLFVEGLTEGGCRAFINHINTGLMKLGKKALPQNKFLITR